MRLRLDVDRLIAVDRIHDRRQVEASRIRTREARIPIRCPLHRRAYAIAIAEIDVVAHTDLVAIVDDWRSGKRKQQRIHELDLAPVVLHQGRETPAYAQIDTRLPISSVARPQIVALRVSHHLER